jgi:hypothetical protein
MALLSDSELAGIQALGISGMTDSVEIYPQTYDSGLDTGDDPFGSSFSHASTPSTTTVGWLVGRWSDVRGVAAGDIDTTTPYRLRLPVGTTVAAGDDVVINANRYHVIDVGDDQTWPEWLNLVVERSK